MKLSSPAFGHNKKIPKKYTCDAEGISPPLEIEDVPPNAKSLVLIMDDPDIPQFAKDKFNVGVWDHWVMFNLPPSLKLIKEHEIPKGITGKNTRGDLKYGGPCPPDKEHRYFFKLYALDCMLDLPEGATKSEVEDAMKEYILEKTELIGLYEREK